MPCKDLKIYLFYLYEKLSAFIYIPPKSNEKPAGEAIEPKSRPWAVLVGIRESTILTTVAESIPPAAVSKDLTVDESIIVGLLANEL